MLARSSKLRHPSGLTVETPLLIPSFSSKGFGIGRKRQQGGGESEISEVSEVLVAASEFLTDSMLVSAYDIYYDYIPLPESAVTEIIFLDSGGYETSDLQDLSASFTQKVASKDWDPEKYCEVIARWPEHIPAVLVSFDTGSKFYSLQEQVENARALFGKNRSHLNDFLIKPETRDQKYVQIQNIVSHAEGLGVFSVIGITEKELGDSCLRRMENIVKIRSALDEAGVSAPIHIFGSLDPITVPLYFMAGAEIFDGLTWLRYGYHGGMAIYRHNFAARHIGIDRRDDFVKLKSLQDNLGSLRDLTNQMKRFLNDNDFSKFGANEQIIREAVDLLRTKVGRRKI